MRANKGIALVYVLVMTVVMAVVAGGILSFMTQQFQLANRQEQTAIAKKADEQALSRFTTAMQNRTPCIDSVSGYNLWFQFCPPFGTNTCCRYTAAGSPQIWVLCPNGSPPPACNITIDYPLP